MPQRLSIARFREMAREGKAPLDAIVPKAGIASFRAIDDAPEGRVIEAVVSTPAVDRMNDSIDVNGWELDNFKANPVVLFGHDSSAPPIARALNTWVDGNQLRSRARFFDESENPMSELTLRLIRAGGLNATSVGFIPKVWQWTEDRGGIGIDFISQELMEWSVVPIPANPEALIASAKGLDSKALLAWAERVPR